jgi:hypothetical protein
MRRFLIGVTIGGSLSLMQSDVTGLSAKMLVLTLIGCCSLGCADLIDVQGDTESNSVSPN